MVTDSSNGKSMTWTQNESSYRPNLWKRMSFHVKKKGSVESNQTAIIKPFSKEGDVPGDAAVTEMFEEPQASPPFTCSSSQSLLLSIGQQAMKGREDGAEPQALPAYVADHTAVVRRRGGDNIQDMVEVVDISVLPVGVGDIGGPAQGTTILDQISCVVSRFTTNINDLNTMIQPGETTIGSSSTAADAPQLLTTRRGQTSSTVTTHAEVANFGENRAGERIYEHLGVNCVSGRRAKNLEELLALTPPSPFRDSSLSSDGSSSPASEAEYDQLLLRHFSQSSSSL